ncbi:SgcJ/EcaC family oxidoreductase [Embleya sp. NBC_00896]|uniref:SgcJ/EcaC family oxidoreductase n=1 Tax=Embleya sp. NBC_00896 TaxID=2975961 RepID=UPI00386EECB2|nr:SgcJ/EcaC family oxidoreductase [Embleya sp. NBC_00896]
MTTFATTTVDGAIDTATAEITALLDSLADAWARGDGAAYGAGFTPDASYVAYFGTLYRGAEEIGAAHQELFANFLKGTRLGYEIVDIRFHGPNADVAVVVTRGDTYKREPGRPGKVQTYTVVRDRDGRRRVAAFQNTARKTLLEALTFRFAPAAKPAVRN